METVGQLAGGIAHDFNNVLSAIMMATDFLLNAHRPTDPSFQDIMQIKQNANRAAALVRQLLAFSRRQTLRPQVLDLGDALSDLTMLLRRLIGEKVKLEVVHGRDLWPVKVDLSQFEQVIVNLAVNARDAMPDGGKLTVRTAQCHRGGSRAASLQGHAGGGLRAGRGRATPAPAFRADVIDKIFEPFFSTKEVGKGTGLGLSTVYGIVKQTGGFIYVDSEVGKGTDLPHLPAAPSCRAGSPTASPPPPKRRGARKRRPSRAGRSHRAAAPSCWSRTRRGCARSMRAACARAATPCSRPATASRRWRCWSAASGKIDLVVSDVVMPEMDGPTLLKELRKTQSRPQDHLRLRLCRGRLREEPAGRRAVRLPAEAVHAQAAGRHGEGDDGAVVRVVTCRGIVV